jgi:hypothetical protein
LIRSTILEVDDEEHVLLVSMHHIVSDGWSIGVIVREMTALYRAYVTGRSAELPELTISTPILPSGSANC